MNFNIQYENPNESLLTRLFKVRGIQDNVENFLNPKLADYWLDPFLLNDMGIAVDRIIRALKNNEKIMIFGDYDVDGVTSSWSIYKFITKFLNYRNVSVQYPDRIKDGYGMKNNHIDEIKNKGVSLIITVDNGIASVNEVLYAKEKGIDIIITDHHKEHDEIPKAFAVVNPQISSKYSFKGLAGVGVAFKLINAILSKSKFNADEKNQIFNYFLPIVAIGTVADVVPLIDENRVIVKNGLDLINNQRHKIPSSLSGFLNYLNLKKNVDTFHIGFVIGPRINAGGRIQSPYDSLNILLYSGKQQHAYLEKIDEINTERKKLQDSAFKIAEEELKHQEKILVVSNDEFHEGIVGIVAGRITEKYNKPSVIFKIDKEKNIAVASLRGPEYFDIMDMLSKIGDKLLRFGGHKHAGGLAVDLDKLDEVKDFFENYCRENIKDSDLEKSFKVDTKIYSHEWNNQTLNDIEKLAPFGEGNKEPVFLIENLEINKIEKVGKNGNGHMKIHGTWDDKKINSLFRGKGSECDKIEKKKVNLIGKARKDSFNGGYFLDGVDWR